MPVGQMKQRARREPAGFFARHKQRRVGGFGQRQGGARGQPGQHGGADFCGQRDAPGLRLARAAQLQRDSCSSGLRRGFLHRKQLAHAMHRPQPGMLHVANVQPRQFGHRERRLHHQPQDGLVAHVQPRLVGGRRVLWRRHGLQQRSPVNRMKHQRIHLLGRRHGSAHIDRIVGNPFLQHGKGINLFQHPVVAALRDGADIHQATQQCARIQRLKVSPHIGRPGFVPRQRFLRQQVFRPARPKRVVRRQGTRRQSALGLRSSLQRPGFEYALGGGGNRGKRRLAH